MYIICRVKSRGGKNFIRVHSLLLFNTDKWEQELKVTLDPCWKSFSTQSVMTLVYFVHEERFKHSLEKVLSLLELNNNNSTLSLLERQVDQSLLQYRNNTILQRRRSLKTRPIFPSNFGERWNFVNKPTSVSESTIIRGLSHYCRKWSCLLFLNWGTRFFDLITQS